MGFNTKTYYLGKLCPKQHHYDDTNFSLRFHSNRGCVQCKKERLATPAHKEKEKDQYLKRKERGRPSRPGRSYWISADLLEILELSSDASKPDCDKRLLEAAIAWREKNKLND